MTQALDEQIIQALQAKPGQTATELAQGLGCQRSEINQRLYGSLRGRVEQDPSYRWRLAGGAPDPADGEAESAAERTANTELAKLACYYLACLGFDDAGVSTFLTSRYDLDYAELPTLPRSPTVLPPTSC
jgi:hypothetical protein